MESIVIKLNQKCFADNMHDIEVIFHRKPGLRLNSIDVTSGRVLVIFNPVYINADTIIEALLQKGYDIDYFCNVA